MVKHNLNSGRRRDKKPFGRSKLEAINIETGLYDCTGAGIKTGMRVSMGHDGINGIVLYNRSQKSFGLFYGLWYGDKNEYCPDCYGKFMAIPADNGMKMDLKIM